MPHLAHTPFLFLLPALGAAYGTAKSAKGIAALSLTRPDFIMKSVIPVVMAGILGIYGLVIAVLIANKCEFSVEEPVALAGVFLVEGSL